MAFHAAENKNRQMDDLSQADFGPVPETFLRSVRTKSITENFVYWKLRLSFVFVVFQLIFFILSLSAYALYDFYSGIVDPLFSFVNKVDFSCQ